MSNDTLDFTEEANAQSKEQGYWTGLDTGTLTAAVSELAAKMNTLASKLEKCVYNTDYDDTAKLFKAMYTTELSPTGYILNFLISNEPAFGKFVGTNTRPDWYATLNAADKKAYDACYPFYKDLAPVKKILENLRSTMMMAPLENAYIFQLMVKNFYDAGFEEKMYHKISSDMETVSDIINTTMNGMEKYAYKSQRVYEDLVAIKSRSELASAYRQSRIADYREYLKAFKLEDSFVFRSDGTVSVNAKMMATAEVIDRYTETVALMPNIEDSAKKVKEQCNLITEGIRAAEKQATVQPMGLLFNALYYLKNSLYDFIDLALTVFTKFKNRDNDSPYFFMKPIPANSRIRAKYSFAPISVDPWKDGTRFKLYYKTAAEALTQHCAEFLYSAHPGLR